MPSLTSLLPTIAPLFGLTEQALYERQRALVRMNLLPAPKGRGRGSGAEATPENVALLTVAVMVTDNLSDTDDRVRKLAFAPFVDGKKDRCPWTGATNFKDALSFILSADAPEAKPSIFTDVTVSRTEPVASIGFAWPKRRQGFSQFGIRDRRRDRLLVVAELPNKALQEIRVALLNNEGAGSS
ncbi:hypothetical protein [Bradyrhizobium sp. Ec3.3]|uniref:hypothetical protein n=1 Tax=Bradyrhizobium sp. Ec3.3 TaxID=189753 RepID=UPI0012EB58B9|nr:hypothetical protein [Bradyrhizobium sp. Ec3.3]